MSNNVFSKSGDQGDQWNEETVDLSSYTGAVMFKITANVTDDGAGVQFKILLDDTAHGNVVDGTITPTISYLMPDTITNGGATFDVTPAPTVSVVNNLISSDDS